MFIAHGQTTITGTLVGSDGKPMPKSHVHLLRLGQTKPVASTEVAKDGTYKISAKETGPFLVQYTGVHHSQENVLVAAQKRVEEKIAVKLASYKYPAKFTSVKIIGDFNSFSFQTAQEMTKQPDGTFTAEFETKADKFRYQLGGIAGGRSYNGTQSEDFEYDGGGDYRSVVTPKNGKARIVFDPRKLVRSNAQSEVRFAEPSSSVAKAAAVYREWMQQRDALPQAFAAHLNAGKAGEFTYGPSAELKRFSKQYAGEKDPVVKQVLLLSQIGLVDLNRPPKPELLPDLLSRAVKEISPASPLWSLNPDAVYSIHITAEDFGTPPKKPLTKSEKTKYQQFVERFLENNPDTQAKAMLLYGKLMIAKSRNDQQAVMKYYDQLITKFGDTRAMTLAKDNLSPDRRIVVGNTVPKFSLVSMSGPKTTYTNESFKGRIYLIDFWATWCVPCVGEMKPLHKAYEKFKSKNFEILSLSFDATPGVVIKFRQGKWKMPWQHVFLGNELVRLLSKEFEVNSIPKPILVDGNTGKILAIEGELRGQNLEKTLSRFLGEVR